ncbi:MAG: NUDIX domain-containing protein [Actinobacteria bacterium]|nr:NUDIX domain-containing protein [Actinomycetota bacterium]
MTGQTHTSTSGALPWRVGARGTIEFGLVHRRKRGDWSIPKGRADPGEVAHACAYRELREETGLDGVLGEELPSIRYRDRAGHEKIVRYWSMEAMAGTFSPNSEIDDFRWVRPTTALHLLTHARERALALILAHRLAALHPHLASPRDRATLVIRGAAAVSSTEWDGSDATRPLADAGRHVAQALTAIAAAFELSSVLSATTVRSVETLAPLARSLHLDVDTTPMLDEDRPVQNLSVVDAVRGAGAAVCMHEWSVRELLTRLHRRDRIRFASPVRVRRGSAWVLTGDARAYRSALYVPIPDADLLGADASRVVPMVHALP